MANNRMYLRCTVCDPEGLATFQLAKYYPSQGWYINRDEAGVTLYGHDFNTWLDQHVHRSLWGPEIVLEREIEK